MLPDPISATDLNIYGDAELPWARALDAMKALPSEETPQFLGTVGRTAARTRRVSARSNTAGTSISPAAPRR